MKYNQLDFLYWTDIQFTVNCQIETNSNEKFDEIQIFYFTVVVLGSLRFHTSFHAEAFIILPGFTEFSFELDSYLV